MFYVWTNHLWSSEFKLRLKLSLPLSAMYIYSIFRCVWLFNDSSWFYCTSTSVRLSGFKKPKTQLYWAEACDTYDDTFTMFKWKVLLLNIILWVTTLESRWNEWNELPIGSPESKNLNSYIIMRLVSVHLLFQNSSNNVLNWKHVDNVTRNKQVKNQCSRS